MANFGDFPFVRSFVDVSRIFRAVSTGLRRLTFRENFETWLEEDIVIPALSEVTVRNRFHAGRPPSMRLIVRQLGNGLVIDGSIWTKDTISLYNAGANPVVVSVLFFK